MSTVFILVVNLRMVLITAGQGNHSVLSDSTNALGEFSGVAAAHAAQVSFSNLMVQLNRTFPRRYLDRIVGLPCPVDPRLPNQGPQHR